MEKRREMPRRDGIRWRGRSDTDKKSVTELGLDPARTLLAPHLDLAFQVPQRQSQRRAIAGDEIRAGVGIARVFRLPRAKDEGNRRNWRALDRDAKVNCELETDDAIGPSSPTTGPAAMGRRHPSPPASNRWPRGPWVPCSGHALGQTALGEAAGRRDLRGREPFCQRALDAAAREAESRWCAVTASCAIASSSDLGTRQTGSDRNSALTLAVITASERRKSSFSSGHSPSSIAWLEELVKHSLAAFSAGCAARPRAPSHDDAIRLRGAGIPVQHSMWDLGERNIETKHTRYYAGQM